LLSFHPLAWTPVCARQMESLERHSEDFRNLNTVAVGVNVDPVPSKKAWADILGIRSIRLLSDFWLHGDVAMLFDIFREDDGFSERVNIVINEDQKIELIRKYPISELPDINEILDFLKSLDEK